VEKAKKDENKLRIVSNHKPRNHLRDDAMLDEQAQLLTRNLSDVFNERNTSKRLAAPAMNVLYELNIN